MLQDLVHIEIKELNKKIKEKGVSKELAVRLKQRRRTLKNRNYATRSPAIRQSYRSFFLINTGITCKTQCSDPDAL
jgi:hypothetical protein